MANDDKAQVNTEMELDLIEKLDKMCLADENNRSQFIRKLIRQEWARRQQMALPLEVVTGSRKKNKNAAAVAVA